MMLTCTVFSGYPAYLCTRLIYSHNLLPQYYLSILGFISSSMYHGLESLQIQEVLLKESEWHQVDNVGAVIAVV
jgi:hypothetical protein